MKNLVFHQGAFGDWILTFPLLRALGGRTLAVTHWSKAVLASRMIEGLEPVDIELREFSRLHAVGGPAVLSRQIEEYFKQARCVVSFVSDGDDPWADNVKGLARDAQFAFIPPCPPEDWPSHVSQWYAACAARQGIELLEAPMPARVDRAGPLVVHPGSGGKEKCWPIERFEEALGILKGKGQAVLVVLGEVEMETWGDPALRRLSDQFETRACLSVDSLYAALGESSMFLGNDTGPSHLAAQMGIPTIALFGPTEPARWAPVGPAVRVLAPKTPRAMDWLSVGAVVEACAGG